MSSFLDVCTGPDGRLHKVSSNGLSTGLYLDGQLIHTPEPLAIAPRMAAGTDRVLVTFRGQHTDTAYVVNDLGRWLALSPAAGNYSQVIDVDASDRFHVAVQTSPTTHEIIVVNGSCDELSRTEGHQPQTSQGFLDFVDGHLTWTDSGSPVTIAGVQVHHPQRRGDWTVGLRGDPNGVYAYQHSTQTLFVVSDLDVQLPARLAVVDGHPTVAVSVGDGVFVTDTNFTRLEAGTVVPGPVAPPDVLPGPVPPPVIVQSVDLTPLYDAIRSLESQQAAWEEDRRAAAQLVAERLDLLEQQSHPKLSGWLSLPGWLGGRKAIELYEDDEA